MWMVVQGKYDSGIVKVRLRGGKEEEMTYQMLSSTFIGNVTM
jgi:hypothetical protein